MPHLEVVLLQAAIGLYLIAMIAYVLCFATRLVLAGAVGSGAAWAGLAAQTAMLMVRAIASGRAPLVTMYEYLVAFSWMIALAYLVFEVRAGKQRADVRTAGALALLLTVILLGYATTLPPQYKQAEQLMPVLKSNWLIFHVSCAVIAYGAAGLASALVLIYFVRIGPGANSPWLLERLPDAVVLDRAVYRAIRFAFPFLTLVNVTGAVWAYNAWGRYWGWDPKETWSLITWMIYIFYLHARLRAQWRPPKANAVVVVGIAAILFTFLGVNQLAAFSASLHSYASGS
jgi:cytochrome c-type biogenesis protein CcsB